jgi:hypothetical protein
MGSLCVLEVLWRCSGGALEVLWRCSGGALEVLRIAFGVFEHAVKQAEWGGSGLGGGFL